MSKEKYLKFKCPQCNHAVLEEVMTDVVQYSNISSIDESGAVDYDPNGVSHDGGEVAHYQCGQCGEILMFEPTDESGDCGYTVGCEEELVEWLKQNCPQDEVK